MGRLAALALAIMLIGAAPAAAAGPTTRGYVLDNAGDALAVFDPATNTVTNRVPLPFDLASFTVRPDGREIYVLDLSLEGRSLAVVSTATNSVVATISVPAAMTALAFTPDSGRAYLTVTNSVLVIDTATRRIVKTIRVTGSRLAVAPDGTKVYVPSSSGVVVISTATNTVTKTIALGRGVGSVEFSPNGRLAVVNSGHLIDVRTDTVTSPTLPLNRSQQRFLFTPDSAGLYIANVCGDDPLRTGNLRRVQLANPSVVRTIFTGGNPNGLALSPDGTRLYVQLIGAGGVSMLDTAIDRVLDTFGVTEAVPSLNGIALSDTAPPGNPGQRLAPRPWSSNLCLI